MKTIPFRSFSQTPVNASKIRGDRLLTSYQQLLDPHLYRKHHWCYASYTHSKNLALFPRCISNNTEPERHIRRSVSSQSKFKVL